MHRFIEIEFLQVVYKTSPGWGTGVSTACKEEELEQSGNSQRFMCSEAEHVKGEMEVTLGWLGP